MHGKILRYNRCGDMGELQNKNVIIYRCIPEPLQSNFEDTIIDSVCDEQMLSLGEITYVVDDFSIYAESYLQYGEPYRLWDNMSLSDDYLNFLRESNRHILVQDVEAVLNHHNFFYYRKKPATDKKPQFQNIPLVRVW